MRTTVNFNQGWRFMRGDAPLASNKVFFDEAWEPVCLPHPVRLEPANCSNGANYQGPAWYRKRFTVGARFAGCAVFLTFDAAIHVADVWLDGVHVGRHLGGYLPFTLDLTDRIAPGTEHALAVRVDNSDTPDVPPGRPQNDVGPSGLDFCYWGGLYRSVRLVLTGKLHITDALLEDKVAGGGVFVTYPSVSAATATVAVKTQVRNAHDAPRTCTLETELVAPGGVVAASGSATHGIAAGGDHTFSQSFTVATPLLWHPDTPRLYTLRSVVRDGDHIADEQVIRVGIRSIRFDAEGGFIVNGTRLTASGANRHQEYVHVGAAMPGSGQYRDVMKLRAAGFVSVRPGHYPPDPAFMDACDERGLMCIIPTPGWQFFGGDAFRRTSYQNIRDMIRRDRNRPSVVLWEPILNETSYDEHYARDAHRITHKEYPGDQSYAAADETHHGHLFDVVYSGETSDKPKWVREYGDGVDNWTDQNGPSRVRRDWGEQAMLSQTAWHATQMSSMFADARLAGFNLWNAIDHNRGYHVNPFWGGILDLYRIPKFGYYLFQSQRDPHVMCDGIESGPMVFIASHWTYRSPSDVTVFSNCARVRLSLNGTVIGEQEPSRCAPNAHLPHPPFVFPGVAYEPGELAAEGMLDEVVVATHIVRTPGVARKVVLSADFCGKPLVADGSDLVMAYASICDARGTVVPYADAEVTFTVEGEGSLVGGAGIGANPARAIAGIVGIWVRATRRHGQVTVTASSFGLAQGCLTFPTEPATDVFSAA